MRVQIGCLLSALAAIGACTNAGEIRTTTSLATGGIAVGFYLDRNGSGVFDAGDTVFAGGRIALLLASGTDTLRVATANAQGVAVFDTVPIGTYRVVVDRHALGDSIGVVAGDTGTIRVAADSLSGSRVIRLGFTEVSIAQARTLPAGKRVFIRGKVVSPLQAFRDSSAFIADTSGAIRITSAVPRTGGGGNNPGDSVLVLGTTGKAQGQGIVQHGVFFSLASGLSPLPQVVTVADARGARGGALDAIFVQLSNVVIVDTIPAAPDFIVKVADPSDSTSTVKVLIDQLLSAPHGAFPIGRTATLRGVLVPQGDGTWMLKPRGGGDIVIN